MGPRASRPQRAGWKPAVPGVSPRLGGCKPSKVAGETFHFPIAVARRVEAAAPIDLFARLRPFGGTPRLGLGERPTRSLGMP